MMQPMYAQISRVGTYRGELWVAAQAASINIHQQIKGVKNALGLVE